MSGPDEADLRIARRERELAQLQSEVTTYRQIEANLVREKLKRTLASAVREFGAGVDQAAGELFDALQGGGQ